MAERIKLTDLDAAMILLGQKFKAGIVGMRALGLDVMMEAEIEVTAQVIYAEQTLNSVTTTVADGAGTESTVTPAQVTTTEEAAAVELATTAEGTETQTRAVTQTQTTSGVDQTIVTNARSEYTDTP